MTTPRTLEELTDAVLDVQLILQGIGTMGTIIRGYDLDNDAVAFGCLAGMLATRLSIIYYGLNEVQRALEAEQAQQQAPRSATTDQPTARSAP